MKHIKRFSAFVLAALLSAQCAASVLAAQPQEREDRWYTIVYDELDSAGNRLPAYLIDDDGNRFPMENEIVCAASDAEFPVSYDARNDGLVTPVKDQSGTGSCWGFAAIAAAEANYIKQGYGTADDTDFSESHLVWFSQRSRSTDPTDSLFGDGRYRPDPYQTGGRWLLTAATLMRGSGLRNEQDAPWNTDSFWDTPLDLMTLPESERYQSDARVISINEAEKATVSYMKQAILEYGALDVSYYNNQSRYNRITGGYYQNKVTNTSHQVCIVGWDDQYSKKNFLSPRPENDGAWLVKNSWGTDFCKDGYFWMSYEEPSLSEIVTYETAPKSLFDNLYQFDIAPITNCLERTGKTKMANVFTAEKTELLTHAAFFLPYVSSEPVSVQVYTWEQNGFSVANPFLSRYTETDATVSEDTGVGYHTVELTSPVKLEPGQTFAVVVTLSTSDDQTVWIPVEKTTITAAQRDLQTQIEDTYFSMPSESFTLKNGKWTPAYYRAKDADTHHVRQPYNVAVKAMTRDLDDTEQAPTLQIETPPDKTEYTVGDPIDLTGMTLRYTDAKGVSTCVDAADSDVCAVSDSYVRQNGDNQFILAYKGLRAVFTVSGKDGTDLRIRRPVKKSLLFGDKLSLYADVTAAPEGTRVQWQVRYVDNPNPFFDKTCDPDKPCVYRAFGIQAGDVIISAALVDEKDEAILDSFGRAYQDQVLAHQNCSVFAILISPLRWMQQLLLRLLHKS